MAAKAKRWNPTPSEVLGAIPTVDPGNAGPASITGRAYKPSGGTGLQQLGTALKRFNPILEKYMVGRENRGMAESSQYLREMEQMVSDNAYGFKTGLKAAGYSQWRNPHVYRNQIMNVAGITAYKDADFLRTDAEFLAAIEAAKKGDDFAGQAELIAEEHLAKNRQRQPTNPKEGGYWDAGYAPKWMEARQRLLQPFLNEKVKADRTEVLENFYENGRNHLLDVIKINQPNYKDPVTGKTRQPGDEINIKPLREYISKQWASYPDGDHSFNQAVFEKIIQPVFLDLVEDPDNELLIESLYERVMKMTRETTNPDGTKSRHSMFKRWKDGVSGGSSGSFNLDEDSFWEKVMDVEAEAHNKQFLREQKEVNRLATGVNLVLKDRANPDWGIHDVPFPYDSKGISTVANTLAANEDFLTKYIRKGGDLHTQLVFREIVQDLTRAIRKADLTALVTEREYGKEIDAKIQTSLNAYIKNTDLFPQIQKMFRKAIGGSTTLEDAKKRATALLNPESLVAGFIAENPTFKPEAAGLMMALSRSVDSLGDNSALSKSNDLIQIASNVARGKDTGSDPYELIAELTDAQNETFTDEDDEALGRAIKMVEKHTQIIGQWESLNRDESSILSSVIDGGANDVLRSVISPHFYFKLKSPDELGEQSGVDLGKPSNLEKEAAHSAFEEMQDDMKAISRKLLHRYHAAHPDPTERDNHWRDSGQKEVTDEIVRQMRERVNFYARTYTDHLRRSQQGRAQTETKQMKTLLEASAAEAKQVDDIAVQMEESLQTLGNIDNKQLFEDNQTATGAASAAHFWTGPSGNKIAEALRQRQKQRKIQYDLGVTELARDLQNLKKAREAGATDQIDIELERVRQKQNYIKNMRLQGGNLDWQDWIDDKGALKQGSDLNFNVMNEDGEEMSVPFNIVGDNLNPQYHLLFNKWDEFDDITVEINAAEKDPEYEFSTKAKGFFKLWGVMTGDDINPHGKDLSDPEVARKLKKAHGNYDRKMRGQMVMFMSRKRGDLPQAAVEHIQNNIVADFLGGDSNMFQDVHYTDREKVHHERFLVHNQKVLNGEVNIEDGLDWDGYLEKYAVVTNGMIPTGPYTTRPNPETGFASDHIIQSGRERDGSPIIGYGRAFIDPEMQDQVASPLWTLQGFEEMGDVERTQEAIDMHGLDDWAIPRKDKIGRQYFLAQELALADMGYKETTNLPDSGWTWPRLAGHAFGGSGISLNVKEFKQKTEHYRQVLSGGPEQNSARARAFNLLLAHSNLTKDKYLSKTNMMGLSPLSIPHKPEESEFPPMMPESIDHSAERSEREQRKAGSFGATTKEEQEKKDKEKMVSDIVKRNAFDLRDDPNPRKDNRETPKPVIPKTPPLPPGMSKLQAEHGPQVKPVPKRKPKPKPKPTKEPMEEAAVKMIQDIRSRNAFDLKEPKKVPGQDDPNPKKSVLSKSGKAALLRKLKDPKRKTAAERILETLKPTPPEAARIIEEMTKRNPFNLKKPKK